MRSSLERKSSPDTQTNQETGSGGTRNRAGAEEVLCVCIKNSLCFGEACTRMCVCVYVCNRSVLLQTNYSVRRCIPQSSDVFFMLTLPTASGTFPTTKPTKPFYHVLWEWHYFIFGLNFHTFVFSPFVHLASNSLFSPSFQQKIHNLVQKSGLPKVNVIYMITVNNAY